VEAHERFEELSAAASIGEASGAELAELREHMAGCPACRETYSEFLQLSGVRTANGMSKEAVSGAEAIAYIDSALFRQKFLKRAEAEGVVFSHVKEPTESPAPHRTRGNAQRWTLLFALPTAAACLIAAGLAGGYFWKSREIGRAGRDVTTPTATVVSAPNDSGQANQRSEIARLEAENQKLAIQIAALKASVAEQTKTALDVQESSAASERERGALASELKQREARISDLERQIGQSQVELASMKGQLDDEKTNENALASERMRVRELSDQLAEQTAALNRERDLLTADRDIRELMAARNLHIADVFDTDAKGKTRPALGRIFFTEGKSLIFYAYDLNDNRVQNAGYNYRVWGKKEGRGQAAKSLGIFYSDDKTQKRWVFKYDDPKVLSEIDSVFVTVEPPGKNLIAPQGDKLLYAYLRNQANHP
jgi:predicted  nucleic acid-binding Zn-ribbon protein